jgi:chitin disaccharide deacetylase
MLGNIVACLFICNFNIMRQFIIFLLVCLNSFFSAYAQQILAEKLGYPKDAKLLILHADDAGLSHSVNAATIAAFEKKGVTSSSIQVPCPWFPEIAAYAKAHPEMDWGVHITLTSEWKNYKWGGVLPSDKILSLLDSNGYFYSSVQEFAKHAKPMEVEAELRAQIKRALSFGIKITHLDCHMGAVYATPELAGIFFNVSKEFGIPAFQMKNMPGITVDKTTVVVDAVYLAFKAAPVQEWGNCIFLRILTTDSCDPDHRFLPC